MIVGSHPHTAKLTLITYYFNFLNKNIAVNISDNRGYINFVSKVVAGSHVIVSIMDLPLENNK
jgi:hypothetical protein